MLPNRIVLIVVLLVYHTRTTSPLWRPYYDRYPLTITDRVRYYRLAYVIQKYASSVILISFCVYHTNVPGYHNHLCNPVTPSPTKQSVPWIDIFNFLIEIVRRKQITSRLCSRHLLHQWRSLRIPPSLWKTSYEKRKSLIMTVTLLWKRVKSPNPTRLHRAILLA